MGLLDMVMSAQGDGAANYGQEGRHVLRLNTIRLRDPSAPGGNAALPPGFRFDGEVLASNRDLHVKGDVITFTDPFKFPQSALARIRRLLSAAKTAKTGSECSESTLGLVAKEGESEKDFSVRIRNEVERLLGSDQPLNGAVITVIATKGSNKSTGKPYTLFEVVVPTEEDIKAAFGE